MREPEASETNGAGLPAALALLVLPLAIAALFACSPQERYEVLSFVFDGVPPPGAVEAQPPTQAQLTTGQPPPWRTDLEAPLFYASVHEPFQEGDCGTCHAPRPALISPPPDQTMCLSCHGQQVVAERWDHGPLRMGLCSLCHEPHLSTLPHLERLPQPEQCTLCHSEPDLMTRVPNHRGPEEQRCTDCHDPHRRGILVALEAQP